MNESKQVPAWIGSCMGWVFALIFLGAGLLIILTAADIIHAPEENFKAPRLIVFAAGLVFFFAGLFIAIGSSFTQEELRQPLMSWMQYFLVLVTMISFSLPFLWAGLGPGEREFTQTTRVNGTETSSRPADETTGRFIFGGFGLVCGLGTVFYAISTPGRIVRGEFKSMFDQNRRTSVIRHKMNDISTERLVLLPLSLPQLELILSDPASLEKELGLVIPRDLLTARVHRAIRMKVEKMRRAEVSQHDWFTYWLVVIRQKNVGAGMLGFKGYPNTEGSTEIGYGMAAAYQHKGYMIEAVQALVDWAFMHPFCRVVTATGVENPASHRLLKKLGAHLIQQTDNSTSWEIRKIQA